MIRLCTCGDSVTHSGAVIAGHLVKVESENLFRAADFGQLGWPHDTFTSFCSMSYGRGPTSRFISFTFKCCRPTVLNTNCLE